MEFLVQANQLLRSVIAWIGHTEVLGVTLDIPAHILGGAAIYYVLAVKGVRPWVAALIVLGLELLKEGYDFSAVLHTGDYLEPVKDVFFTLLGAALGHYLSRPVGDPPEAEGN